MATQQGLLTAEEFAALQHEGLRLELIEGELHAMAPSYADHGDVVGALHVELGVYIRRNHLGKIYGAETGFLVARDPDTVRAPDIAFIQASRVTPAASAPNWNPIIPDLVVEVVSSGDRASAHIATRTNLVAQTTDTMVNLVIAEDPSAAYITATVRGLIWARTAAASP